LHAEIEKLGGDVDVDEKMDDDEPAMETEDVVEDDGFTVPQYESGEDYENQSELKMKAADSKNAGNLEDALESYNGAVTAAPPSALLLSNRAIVLEKLGHYKAAEDSAKALKTRGKLRFEHLNDWEGALG
jgi:tetratricopeptide (TPR) repeat protein